MFKAMWDWLWKAPDRRWTAREMQERVLALELEWSDVLDKLLAREDRERKRVMKALRDRQSDPEEVKQGEMATKDDLRAKLKRLRTGA